MAEENKTPIEEGSDVEINENLTPEIEPNEPEVITFTQEELDKFIAKKQSQWRKKMEKEAKAKEGLPDDGGSATEADSKLRQAEEKAEIAEMKILCYEKDVMKEYVDDVITLAKSYVNDDTDLDEAIDKIIGKYPHFASKKAPQKEDRAAWGQRQGGSPKIVDGVEAAFLKRNPGLKID